MDDEIGYMRNHPPRCLGVGAKPATDRLRGVLCGELGENSTAFGPKCGCSGEHFALRTAVDWGPTRIICSKCKEHRVIFDPALHGYDGELGLNNDVDFSEEQVDVSCNACGNKSFGVALGFQYSGETDILEEEPQRDLQPEDLFGWVMIAVECESCGTLQEVTQEECA